MKTKIFLFSVSIILLIIASSNTNAQTDEDLTKLKYFQINVTASDDTLFLNVQRDMEIDPVEESYILIVNITSDNPGYQTIIFSKDKNSTAIMKHWNDLSEDVRNGLIAWAKPNKTNMRK